MKQPIEPGQTLLDALVYYTGSIDGLFEFLKLNNKQSLDFIPDGEMLFPEIDKKSVVQQLQNAGVMPATADTQIYPEQTE